MTSHEETTRKSQSFIEEGCKSGYIQRASRGRVATALAYEHFNKRKPSEQNLFA